MKKMNPVVHFEIPADNTKRVADFYGEAFGWESNAMGGKEYGGYVVTMTTKSDKKGPLKPGAINGGFFKKTKKSGERLNLVIAVDDLNEATGKVKKAGGKINGKPMEIPKVGMYVSFTDTEGNRLGMLQPSGMMG